MKLNLKTVFVGKTELLGCKSMQPLRHFVISFEGMPTSLKGKNHVQTVHDKIGFALSAKKFLQFYVSHVPTPTSPEIYQFIAAAMTAPVSYRVSDTLCACSSIRIVQGAKVFRNAKKKFKTQKI